MKRTIASTVPLLALLIGAGHASAQRAPNRAPLDPVTEQSLRAEQSAAHRLEKLLQPYRDNYQLPPQELREKIRPLVEESFEARQRLQKAELDALRRRLADIEQAIENREKSKEAIINGRVEDVLNRKVSRQDALTRPDDPNIAEGELRRHDGADDPLTPREPKETSDADIETRERLAELDVQEAEEDYQAAEKDLVLVRQQYQVGSSPERTLRTAEKEQRHAASELKRARIKLQGLARQRADLEAKADAAIDARMAAEREAMGKLHTCEAEMETAKARVAAAEAEVDKAEAEHQYEQKQYLRLKNLFEQKSVGQEALDKAMEQVKTGKATRDGASAALAIAMANVNQSKRAIEAAQAEVKAAEARVLTAKIERDRLVRRGQGDVAPARQENIPTGTRAE